MCQTSVKSKPKPDEPSIRFRKEHLHWTLPQTRTVEAAELWTMIVTLAQWFLFLARDIVVGTMDHIVTRWLLKDMSYSLFENLEDTFELLVAAFKADESKAVSHNSTK